MKSYQDRSSEARPYIWQTPGWQGWDAAKRDIARIFRQWKAARAEEREQRRAAKQVPIVDPATGMCWSGPRCKDCPGDPLTCGLNDDCPTLVRCDGPVDSSTEEPSVPPPDPEQQTVAILTLLSSAPHLARAFARVLA